MKNQVQPRSTLKPLQALELFAGAGGLGLGLEWAGINVAVANEFERVFAETYAANHGRTEVFQGDILDKTLRARLLRASKGVDLVVGGPPCQGFSTVGSKKEHDPRNRLFYAFLEVVRDIRPKAVLFENVSGFRRMYAGRAFHALHAGLEKLGYFVPSSNCRILNAANYGVPQLRQRTFVVAFRSPTPFAFPEATHALETDLFSTTKALTLKDALSDLPVVAMGEKATRYRTAPANEYQRMMRTGVKDDALLEQEGPNHGEKLMRMIRHVTDGGTVLDIPKRLRPRGYFANTYARLWWDRPSTTITRNLGTPSSSRCIHPLVDRGLTTREGARLQSFPDGYFFVGTRSEKNLQIGNAVPPLLGLAVGSSIMEAMGRAASSRVA
jgi:DNA (cytosine-5)-methyltransferase 1